MMDWMGLRGTPNQLTTLVLIVVHLNQHVLD